MKALAVVLFVQSSIGVSSAVAATVSVQKPTVEMLQNPVGLDIPSPRFAWQIASAKNGIVQKAYEILVATSPELLTPGKADLWDSHLVNSDHQNYITYGGRPLQSRQRCYWKVLVKTNAGKVWSEPQFWQNGFFHASDWKAQWIGREYADDNIKDSHTQVKARYLRKEFNVNEPIKNATLYISGLGLYVAKLNGQRIGKQEMAPGPTDYNFSVKYNTFDVTSLLKNGGNAIGVMLGNGRFTTMRPEHILHYGTPRLLLQLEITLQSGKTVEICSDPSWQITNQGPTGTNNEFDGEKYDARQEMPGWDQTGFQADARWQSAQAVEAPKGRINAQTNPNITVMERIHPVSIKELEPNVFIIDMGQNMVGRLRASFHNLQKGQMVKMHFAETLQKDGNLYTANLRTANTSDYYYAKGENTETWAPSFTYHGFRFVKVRGLQYKPTLDDFVGEVLYDEMATTGSMETSDEVFNQIYKNAYWGIRGNYRGMPTDCPQRDERMGWTGDRGVGCLGECYIFNNHQLYSKWMDDIADDQKPSGSISDVNPIYWQVYSDNMTWPCVWITASEMLYHQFGDLQPIRKHYTGMKRWMDYMKNKYMKDYIVTKDTYGDWCMPPEKLELIHSKDPSRITNGSLLSTTFYYFLAQKMAKFAVLVGHQEDVSYWNDLADKVRDAFNTKFLNTSKGYYSNNTVTANILPLRFGMTPLQFRAQIFKNIFDKTTGEFNSHISCGLIGVQQLMRGLSDYGQADLAFQIATNTTYPSWGYMAKQGATTIWELWNGNTADPAMNSGNHVMLLGDLIIWAYEYLGGITQEDQSIAFKQIRLQPRPASQLNYVNADYESIYGTIKSHWKKPSENHLNWEFQIPCNTSACVYVPATDAAQKAAKKAGGKLQQKTDDNQAVYLFPSGNYTINY